MLSQLVHTLIDPIVLLLILVFLVFLYQFKKKDGYYRFFFVCFLIWLLVISTPFVPNLLIRSLETEYEPLSEQALEEIQTPVDIVVLGGGHTGDLRLPPNTRLSGQALMRLVEGIRLHHLLPNSHLVLSGGSSSGQMTQAEHLAEAAYQLKVSPDAISLHTEPEDTWEETLAILQRSQQQEELRTVIIVTSAAHMPRAMAMIKNRGIENALASPTNYLAREDGRSLRVWDLAPSVNNVKKMKNAVKEYAGLAEFHLLLKS